jgi:hypothetical protein
MIANLTKRETAVLAAYDVVLGGLEMSELRRIIDQDHKDPGSGTETLLPAVRSILPDVSAEEIDTVMGLVGLAPPAE